MLSENKPIDIEGDTDYFMKQNLLNISCIHRGTGRNILLTAENNNYLNIVEQLNNKLDASLFYVRSGSIFYTSTGGINISRSHNGPFPERFYYLNIFPIDVDNSTSNNILRTDNNDSAKMKYLNYNQKLYISPQGETSIIKPDFINNNIKPQVINTNQPHQTFDDFYDNISLHYNDYIYSSQEEVFGSNPPDSYENMDNNDPNRTLTESSYQSQQEVVVNNVNIDEENKVEKKADENEEENVES